MVFKQITTLPNWSNDTTSSYSAPMFGAIGDWGANKFVVRVYIKYQYNSTTLLLLFRYGLGVLCVSNGSDFLIDTAVTKFTLLHYVSNFNTLYSINIPDSREYLDIKVKYNYDSLFIFGAKTATLKFQQIEWYD